MKGTRFLFAVAAIPLSQLGPGTIQDVASESRYLESRIAQTPTPQAANPEPRTKFQTLVESAQRQLSPIFDSMRMGTKLGQPQGLKAHDEFIPYVSQSIELKTPLL